MCLCYSDSLSLSAPTCSPPPAVSVHYLLQTEGGATYAELNCYWPGEKLLVVASSPPQQPPTTKCFSLTGVRYFGGGKKNKKKKIHMWILSESFQKQQLLLLWELEAELLQPGKHCATTNRSSLFVCFKITQQTISSQPSVKLFTPLISLQERGAVSPAACFLTIANCQRLSVDEFSAGWNDGGAIRLSGQDVKAAGCCNTSGRRQVERKEKVAKCRQPVCSARQLKIKEFQSQKWGIKTMTWVKYT